MTKEEAHSKGFSIEDYGNGFIIADYSSQVIFFGKSLMGKRQPIFQKDEWFETEQQALEACDRIEKGISN